MLALYSEVQSHLQRVRFGEPFFSKDFERKYAATQKQANHPQTRTVDSFNIKFSFQKQQHCVTVVLH